MTIDDEICVLEIVDLVGGEDYAQLREGWIVSCEGYLVVYSITSRPSFELISELKDHVVRVRDTDNVPMVLVGNKCDLEESRQVSTAEGEQLALSLGVPFMETSAKSGHSVEQALFDTVRMMRRHREEGVGGNNHKRGCTMM